jgi:nicotinamidase-related amidase
MEALLVVDMQNDFLQGGSVHTQGANSIIEPIN